MLNALTVDVEDYFQVSAFDNQLSRADWDSMPSRVVESTNRLLRLFDDRGARGTFFVLGWVAERYPHLVRAIQAAGHEIASHGYEHRLVYENGPAALREDLRRSRGVLESITGLRVRGYRAPSYSVTRQSLWALDILIEEGYEYDSSIYPIRHDRYGIPDWPRQIHEVRRPGGSIWELPGSTVQVLGTNLPIGGGGYFRLLPYMWTALGIARLNRKEGRPAIFYIHPWEVDPGQPRLPGSMLSRFRHYRNLDRTEGRLQTLLTDFEFGTVAEVLDTVRVKEPAQAASAAATVLWPA